MKGLILNLLQDVVEKTHGEAAWDGLLEAAGVEGAYTALGTYPDEELSALLRAASEQFAMPIDDAVVWFGESAFPLLYARYPGLFDGHDSAVSLIVTLNDVIHPEVNRLLPGSRPPLFVFERDGDSTLRIHYSSARQLCSLAEGFVHAAASHFSQSVRVDHSSCMKKGDAECILVCAFAGGDGDGRP